MSGLPELSTSDLDPREFIDSDSSDSDSDGDYESCEEDEETDTDESKVRGRMTRSSIPDDQFNVLMELYPCEIPGKGRLPYENYIRAFSYLMIEEQGNLIEPLKKLGLAKHTVFATSAPGFFCGKQLINFLNKILNPVPTISVAVRPPRPSHPAAASLKDLGGIGFLSRKNDACVFEARARAGAGAGSAVHAGAGLPEPK